MKVKKLALVTALAGGLACAPAMAQDAGFYLGGSVGYSDFDIDAGPARAAGATTFSSDDSDTGWKLFAGYQFNRNWGVELGYVDFGSVGFNGTVGAVPFAGSADVTAWTGAAVGTLPLSPSFDLFGKLGLYNGKVKGGATAAGVPIGLDDDDTDGFGGLGARYNLSRNVGVQAEWEHFAGSSKTNLFSVGLRVKF